MQTAAVALSQGYKPREPRQKVVVSARMRVDGRYSDVCIRDISSRGMMLQAATPPRPGSYIEIMRAAQIVVARVVWAGERRFGIQSQDRIDVPAMVSATPSSGPRLPDQERRLADRARPAGRAAAIDLAELAEQNRRRSRAFEFGLLVACGLLAAGLAGHIAYDVLASPLKTVSSHLAGHE
jgi:hypothetical protein